MQILKRLWILRIAERRAVVEESASKSPLPEQILERRQIETFALPARQMAVSESAITRFRRPASALGLPHKLFSPFQAVLRFMGTPEQPAREQVRAFALRKTETTTRAALWNSGCFRISLRCRPPARERPRKEMLLRLRALGLEAVPVRFFFKTARAAILMPRLERPGAIPQLPTSRSQRESRIATMRAIS